MQKKKIVFLWIKCKLYKIKFNNYRRKEITLIKNRLKYNRIKIN